MQPNDRKKGFTILELLIVMALIVVLATSLFKYVSRSLSGKMLVEEGHKIVAIMNQARTSAITQEGGSAWGVRFVSASTTAYYDLWGGESYASGTVARRAGLPGVLKFADVPPGEYKEANFAAVSGTLSAPFSITVEIRGDATRSRTVRVDESGRASLAE